MSTTAQWVFDKAMALADQLSDAGQADFEYNKDLKDRALHILNVMRFECARVSDQYLPRRYTGRRDIPKEISDWNSPLDGIDDGVAQGAMPYGLAAQLMIDEDPDVASFCNQKYQEMLAVFQYSVPQEFEPIWYPYGAPDDFHSGSRW